MLAQVGELPAALESQFLAEGHSDHAHLDSLAGHVLSPEAVNARNIAGREANCWNALILETMHLLLALLRDETTRIARLLGGYGVQYKFLFNMAAYDLVGLRFS